MTITNRLGRPMLAAMFISGGLDQLREPDEKTAPAERIASEIDEHVDHPPLPERPRDLVLLNGGVQLAGGVLLAVGWFPRLASVALAGSLIPTTLGAHRFWEIDDESDRMQQRIHFMKNLAMLGGLVLSMGDHGGRPSLSWRARKAMRTQASGLQDAVGDLRRTASDVAGDLADVPSRLT